MQFGNDVFDVYKDRNGNIHTLLTTTRKMEEVRQLFKTAMEQGYGAIARLGYKEKDKKSYFRMFSLCLCSRCFVCLDQLESQEAKTGNQFIPAEYTRQDLVCDMEKKSNLWRSLKYHIRQKLKIPAEPKL
jgi:hypothetical protein